MKKTIYQIRPVHISKILECEVSISCFMLRVGDIVKELEVFKRNKVPVEVKILGIATYI
jgi:hypothetical protein